MSRAEAIATVTQYRARIVDSEDRIVSYVGPFRSSADLELLGVKVRLRNMRAGASKVIYQRRAPGSQRYVTEFVWSANGRVRFDGFTEAEKKGGIR